jgi:hypothetical protein
MLHAAAGLGKHASIRTEGNRMCRRAVMIIVLGLVLVGCVQEKLKDHLVGLQRRAGETTDAGAG